MLNIWVKYGKISIGLKMQLKNVQVKVEVGFITFLTQHVHMLPKIGLKQSSIV